MGLIYAAVTALCLGVSDFFAARAGRTSPAFAVTRTALLTASVLSPLFLLFGPFRFSVSDSALAAGSGILMGSGLTMLYEGYRSSRVGVVGPVSSVLVAAVPIVYDLVRSVELSRVQWAGMIIGTAALGLTSYAPGGQGRVARGALLGGVSGLCFGVAFVLMSRTSKASGLSTIVVQRCAAFLFLSALMTFVGGPWLTTRRPASSYAIMTGVVAGIGVAALQLGLRNGAAGLVSVAASQFATVTVLLTVIFERDRLRSWQAVGVACTAVGVGLMAVG